MYLIGKVQCSRSLLDGFLLSLRSKDDNFLAGQVFMDEVEQLQGIHVWADEYFFHLLQPLVHLAVVLADVALLLVSPVRGNAFLGNIVHSLRTYLHLYPDARIAHQSTVKSLIPVALRMLHPVSDTIRLVTIYSCDYRKYVVTLVSLAFF